MPKNDYMDLKKRADALRDAGKFQEALKAYDKAIQLRPQFWGAFYEKGDALLKLNKPLEASSAFMSAWLYSRFRKEPGLMCARALVLAEFCLEACLIFEKIAPSDLDPFSALMFAEALQKEGRVREALALAPVFKDCKDPALPRVLGALCLSMGNVALARQYLEAALPHDANGYVHDNLIGVYYAVNDITALRTVLEQAVTRFKGGYYAAQLAALDVLERKPVDDLEIWLRRERGDIVDSALYMQPHVAKGCQLMGTTYQTFETVRPLVAENGLILEFGVRNGHTIHGLAELYPQRKVYGFDSFEGLPEAWNNEEAGSYTALGRLPKVPANVEFVVGWFNDTLPGFTQAHPEPVAFMNVDCDLYSATKSIFEELNAQIVPGTVIVFDEYIVNKSWREDEFRAFQEWVAANNVQYEYLTASFYTKQVAVRILSRN